jgi:signal transduction histidine kinase
MRADDLRPLALLDGLDDEQVDQLVSVGEETPIVPGTDLFHEGEHADSWWLLVDGALDLVRVVGGEETVVRRMDVPGQWAGGFRAWDESGVYLATGRGAAPGRMLRVPAEALRDRLQAWFPFGVHLIGGLYATARSIESTARQRESLVTLGTLAAGLAHELNNPAAAATRSVDALDAVGSSLLASLRQLADCDLTPEHFARLDELRQQITPRSSTPDPIRLADDEEELATWLERRGVERAWTMASPLATAGVDVAWCERAAELLEGPTLEPGLAWVASTVSAGALIQEVREATRRISELVAAVRSYTQLDRASIQPLDVTEGLESTLVMLGHKLRGGITIVREYDADLPRIEGYAGELNQVWTNLVDNAVDAMDGEGTLHVVARREPDAVVVEIGDTGAGMPPEVAARAFEAFFSTKDVGKGTGLGLDIARRIVVERHRGEIEIESAPGRTVMRVRLPC